LPYDWNNHPLSRMFSVSEIKKEEVITGKTAACKVK
jgi:hypothetical protein